MSLRQLAHRGRTIAFLSSALLVAGLVAADARPGGGKNSGSRGSHTTSAPPSTSTAPQGAQPMQRTQQPASAPAAATQGAANSAAAAAQPSRMRGLMMGLGAGLLGAGLFGLLTGSGLFGGLSGLASILGFMLQIALVVGLGMLAFRLFRRRSEAAQPAMAGATAASANAMPRMAEMQPSSGPAPVPAPQPVPASEPVELAAGDFDVFEQRLQEVMSLYSQGHVDGLRRISTPEMAGYFEEDLAGDAKKGVSDQTKDIALLQGDLSEAWRENGFDYATVAMRFGFINTVTDRRSGAIVEGSATERQEATEYWTFVRPSQGGSWRVSAIQQVG